jgi:hypothetical protein
MKRLFDSARPHFAAWVWLYDIDTSFDGAHAYDASDAARGCATLLCLMCGFVGLAEHLIAAYSRGVNSKGGSHTTPLRAASVKGHLKVASLLLRNGADPDSRDHLGRVPLHRVSQGGQLVMAKSSLEIARLLVNSAADVNVTDDEGCAPLHAAAQSGYREIAELLLGSSASLDARNKKQQTPLQLSCFNGKPDVALFLIDRQFPRREWLHSITRCVMIRTCWRQSRSSAPRVHPSYNKLRLKLRASAWPGVQAKPGRNKIIYLRSASMMRCLSALNSSMSHRIHMRPSTGRFADYENIFETARTVVDIQDDCKVARHEEASK